MHLRPWMSVAAAVLGFFVILAWRIREGRTAVTLRKIVIPPLGMASGFCMFLAPPFRVPWAYAGVAFALGALVLAYPLIRTCRLTLVGDVVMVQRSASFFLVLVALAVAPDCGACVPGHDHLRAADGGALLHSGVRDDLAVAGVDASGVSAGGGGERPVCGLRQLHG